MIEIKMKKFFTTSSEKLLLVLYIFQSNPVFPGEDHEGCMSNLLHCDWELFSPLPAQKHINKTIPDEKRYL